MNAVGIAILTTSLTVGGLAAFTDNASVGGKWQLHQSIVGNESDSACSFTQDGADFSGTCSSDQATGKVTGKVADNKITWTYKSEYNGSPITLTYAGTLASGKITGAVHVEEYSVDGEFTATLSK